MVYLILAAFIQFSSVWRKYCLIFPEPQLKLDSKMNLVSFSWYYSSHHILDLHFCAIHTPCVSLCPLCVRGMWGWWVAYTLGSAPFIDKSPLSCFKVQLEGINRFWICKQCYVTVCFPTVFTDCVLMMKGFCGCWKWKCSWSNTGEWVWGVSSLWLV